jgi:EmrB/QacA subfamily drug resistance transporter
MSQTQAAGMPPESRATTQGGVPRLRGVALVSVLVALMLTLLLEALDQTIVGTALPSIVGSLQGFDRYSWVVTAYLLASTTMIPVVSKLSDQFGRKWFLIGGVVIFLVGSALSGMAQNMNELIAFRAIQGVGAGTGIALVFTAVGDIFAPAERARWQGIFTGVYGFSSVVGPTLGGWLTDHGPLLGSVVTNATRWRWIFYINVPVGVLALLALVIYMPARLSQRSNAYRGWAAFKRVDFLGALLVAAATICLLLGLSWGSEQTYAWNSPQIVGVLIAAGVLYALFFLVEHFALEPLLPLNLFRNQVFTADSFLTMFMGMTLLPLVIYLPLFLQGVLGESPTNSGLVLTPLTVSIVFGATISGLLIGRLGRYQLQTIIAAIILSIGVVFLGHMIATTTYLQAGAYMLIAGVGLGLLFPVQTIAGQNAVPRNRIGVGTGVIVYLRALGQTLGVAIAGTAVNNAIASDLPKRVPAHTIERLTPAGWQAATNTEVLIDQNYRNAVVHTAQRYASKAATAHIPPGPQHDVLAQQVAAQASQQVAHLLNQVFDALKQSIVLAIQHGFLVVLVFCGAAMLATFFLKDIPLVKSWQEEKPEEGEPAEPTKKSPPSGGSRAKTSLPLRSSGNGSPSTKSGQNGSRSAQSGQNGSRSAQSGQNASRSARSGQNASRSARSGQNGSRSAQSGRNGSRPIKVGKKGSRPGKSGKKSSRSTKSRRKRSSSSRSR